MSPCFRPVDLGFFFFFYFFFFFPFGYYPESYPLREYPNENVMKRLSGKMNEQDSPDIVSLHMFSHQEFDSLDIDPVPVHLCLELYIRT